MLPEREMFELIGDELEFEGDQLKEYYKWEQQVSTHLRSKGWIVGTWYTSDGDSFGPLVRAVMAVTPDNIRTRIYYG